MCVIMISMRSIIMRSLLGWAAFGVEKKTWDNKSFISCTAVPVYNLRLNTDQSRKAKQTNI